MVENNIYLSWPNEHRRWWGPGGHRYLKQIGDPGRYKEAQALEICTLLCSAVAATVLCRKCLSP
ncbi:hypothetical protein GOB26_28570 [Sinorhizobium meliloti]|nr:hypothetical protein [Sinorhizobium meliloti]